MTNADDARHGNAVRQDWDALIDIVPVGVVVFDVATGMPRSFNREALRLVEVLCAPGQSPEDLLGVITFQRSDGRELSLLEFSMAEALATGETVRADCGCPTGGESPSWSTPRPFPPRPAVWRPWW